MVRLEPSCKDPLLYSIRQDLVEVQCNLSIYRILERAYKTVLRGQACRDEVSSVKRHIDEPVAALRSTPFELYLGSGALLLRQSKARLSGILEKALECLPCRHQGDPNRRVREAGGAVIRDARLRDDWVQ